MTMERRIDAVSMLGVAFVAGYITCAAANHVKDLWSQHGQLVVVQKTVIPKLAAKVNCEHRRAEVATTIAKGAIAGAISDTAPIPSPSAIPKDNCGH